jgi:hypothetical protein
LNRIKSHLDDELLGFDSARPSLAQRSTSPCVADCERKADGMD